MCVGVGRGGEVGNMKALSGSLWLWVILPLFDIVIPDRTLDALMSPLLSTLMLLGIFFSPMDVYATPLVS